MERTAKADGSSLIFLGTGCSTGLPSPRCLIHPSDPPCPVCSYSLKLPPQHNPNYRCNTSLLIDYLVANDEHKYILIDAGKTFREQVLRWFTFHKIPRLDSILLTHDHADAVLGLSDLHCVRPLDSNGDVNPISVYATQECCDSVVLKFPHLSKKVHKHHEDIGQVTQVDWRIIQNDCHKPFIASGLQVCPLPVMHGEDYVALGFLFGDKCKVAYVSDVSRFPSTTEYIISKETGEQLDLLILDTNCIYLNGQKNTHFCFPETLDAVRRICPKRALLIGMNHGYDHHKINKDLLEWSEREGIPVQLAHDGLRVPIEL
ncbi:putative hydrolase C777.06c [Amaranthus tricolor]|uniref:putative hydrolase C777.06c n=1 Tax=Amaranthus tricolor TaxID=29722 RepID=UPI00258C37AC|nr:putative hydrolase C777.06c [Amaranthus tricolor]